MHITDVTEVICTRKWFHNLWSKSRTPNTRETGSEDRHLFANLTDGCRKL